MEISPDYVSPAEKQRQAILGILVRDLPRGFWEDLRASSRRAYLDAYHQILNNPNVLASQRLDMLYQDRHFYMEAMLKTLADKHGLASSETLLAENNRTYVYASIGAVGLTEVYVPAIGEVAKPARFRERYSSINGAIRNPGLDLGLEPRELLEVKAFYGMIAHNPAGRKFTEDDQTLGMIQLCVPVEGCTSWAAQFSLQEIISAYEVKTESDRGPEWKRGAADDKGRKEER